MSESMIHKTMSSLWSEVTLEKERHLNWVLKNGLDFPWSRGGWRSYSMQRDWYKLKSRDKTQDMFGQKQDQF